MSQAIEEKVVSILAALKRVPAETITRATTLEQLGVDSLDKINLLFELESAFNIDIPDEEASAIRSVADIVQKLEAVGAKLDTAGA